jgi:DNA polymerase I-like protein with 3'-5' exonuclease and polymerase domains
MLIGGSFTRIEWLPINLNSSDQVKNYFFKHGWVPTEYNYKKDPNTKRFLRDDRGNPIPTSPKLTEDSFDSIEGDLPKLLARRNVLVHRKRMLKNIRKTDDEETGLINSVRSDGRIGAGGIPNATNTGRVAHRTVVNIPGVGSVYGAEFRDLFTSAPGYVLLGCDAAALEARIQAHYVMPYAGGKELADLLLNGDIHQVNADLWGCSRKEAKSPYYALMYGAQPAKLAQTMNCSLREATERFEAFWNAYSPLARFKENVTGAWDRRGGKKNGFLRGLDGRKLFARSEHALVNLMFQSAGSISVKTALLFANKGIQYKNLDAHQVIFYHDEVEYEVKEDDVEETKHIVEKSFPDASNYYKLNVPLVGEGKVGKTWYDVH